jgi:succinate-semialdehyde dehydrogenase/glutarate-semialdehyde dehydrogenase
MTSSQRRLTSIEPATGRTLGSVALTDPEAIAGVVAGVRKVAPLWELLRVQDRARYVRRVAQAVIDEFEELTELLAREGGRPPAEVAVLELLAAIDALAWIADQGPALLHGQPIAVSRSMFPHKRARTAQEAYGVIAVIGAGSAPFAQPLAQIGAALLAGNGVLFKPAARACLAGERIERALGRAGLPEGLFALVHGGPQAGLALAQAPVDKVLFTGSPPTARAVARACVSRDREVTIELGGKDAMVVLADAHVARAVDGAVWAGFAAAGQARGCVERIYVQSSVYARFVDELVARSGALAVGDPLVGATQVGPLASQRRLTLVCELVDEAVRDGATLRCGGPLRPDGLSGAFYAPAVLTDVTHAMRVMREPIDGPVLAVMAVDSVDEAITLVNDCDYRLGASVWSADRFRAQRIARELQCGMVWLNEHLPSPTLSQGPWGASAGAGLGRTLGAAGLRACAQEKLITWDPSGARGLWRGPYDDTLALAARSVAQLRSGRQGDRRRAWSEGAQAMARVAGRALNSGRRHARRRRRRTRAAAS